MTLHVVSVFAKGDYNILYAWNVGFMKGIVRPKP